MAALFLRHHGMQQSEREAIGPLRVLPHVAFAVAGFGLWVAYAVSDRDALGWAGMAALGVAFLIAGTFLLTREQHRRRDLARWEASARGAGRVQAAAAAAGTPAGAASGTTLSEPGTAGAGVREAIPAEHFIPIWLASAHGLLGGATLVLVLLQRAGVGGS